MAAEMARRDPKDSEWRTRNAHAVRMNESAEAALAYLMKEREAFEDDAVTVIETRKTATLDDIKAELQRIKRGGRGRGRVGGLGGAVVRLADSVLSKPFP